MTIKLSPDLEQLIEDQARQHGLDVEAYIASLLHQTVSENTGTKQRGPLSADERVRQWDDLMAEIDRNPPTMAPPLSDEALTRESIYDDERHRI